MGVIQKMCESCFNWMQFTIDIEENNKDMKVLMLDINVWREGNKMIKHEFYQKACDK